MKTILLLSSSSEELTLAKAYKRFLENNPTARAALKSSSMADQYHVSIVKKLYNFLKSNDFDCEVLLGIGFRKSLVNASPSLMEALDLHGHAITTKHIEHAVVKVNQLIIDPSYRRLGSSYETRDNYPARDFATYWTKIRPIKHLLDLTSQVLLSRIEELSTRQSGPSRSSPPPAYASSMTSKAKVPTNVHYWLLKMAKYLYPSGYELDSVRAFSNLRVCHKSTAQGIQKSSSDQDIIWFFGKPIVGNPGKDGGGILHSVLTDDKNNVLVDVYPGNPDGHFDQEKGYFSPILNKGSYIPVAFTLSVGRFKQLYSK